MRRMIVVVVAVLGLVLMPVAAQADNASPYYSWKWGSEGPAVCKIGSFLSGSLVTKNGKKYVKMEARFYGCNKGRTTSGDLVLNLIAISKGKGLGSQGKLCPDRCSIVRYIPYTGHGTYTALASYTDGGYLSKFGHDPGVRHSLVF